MTHTHTAIQLLGYLLLRGGLLLASAGAFFWVFKSLFALWVLPPLVIVGLALIATGLMLVMVSLVLERRYDESRGERLREP